MSSISTKHTIPGGKSPRKKARRQESGKEELKVVAAFSFKGKPEEITLDGRSAYPALVSNVKDTAATLGLRNNDVLLLDNNPYDNGEIKYPTYKYHHIAAEWLEKIIAMNLTLYIARRVDDEDPGETVGCLELGNGSWIKPVPIDTRIAPMRIYRENFNSEIDSLVEIWKRANPSNPISDFANGMKKARYDQLVAYFDNAKRNDVLTNTFRLETGTETYSCTFTNVNNLQIRRLYFIKKQDIKRALYYIEDLFDYWFTEYVTTSEYFGNKVDSKQLEEYNSFGRRTSQYSKIFFHIAPFTTSIPSNRAKGRFNVCQRSMEPVQFQSEDINVKVRFQSFAAFLRSPFMIHEKHLKEFYKTNLPAALAYQLEKRSYPAKGKSIVTYIKRAAGDNTETSVTMLQGGLYYLLIRKNSEIANQPEATNTVFGLLMFLHNKYYTDDASKTVSVDLICAALEKGAKHTLRKWRVINGPDPKETALIGQLEEKGRPQQTPHIDHESPDFQLTMSLENGTEPTVIYDNKLHQNATSYQDVGLLLKHQVNSSKLLSQNSADKILEIFKKKSRYSKFIHGFADTLLLPNELKIHAPGINLMNAADTIAFMGSWIHASPETSNMRFVFFQSREYEQTSHLNDATDAQWTMLTTLSQLIKPIWSEANPDEKRALLEWVNIAIHLSVPQGHPVALPFEHLPLFCDMVDKVEEHIEKGRPKEKSVFSLVHPTHHPKLKLDLEATLSIVHQDKFINEPYLFTEGHQCHIRKTPGAYNVRCSSTFKAGIFDAGNNEKLIKGHYEGIRRINLDRSLFTQVFISGDRVGVLKWYIDENQRTPDTDGGIENDTKKG